MSTRRREGGDRARPGRSSAGAAGTAATGAGRAPHPAWSALVGAAFAALYLTMAPHVTGPKDAAEFTLDLAFAGIPHPTGYPLYVLAGHLFVRALHALGASWGYAANGWSAVGGGVAMGLLHALASRLVPSGAPLGRTARGVLGLLPVMAFGVNPVWLLDAEFAEVYTWHLAWLAAAALFLFAALRSLDPSPGRRPRGAEPAAIPGGTRLALGWGCVAGLGLAHHVTAVLAILPGTILLVVAAVRAGRWRPWLILAATAGALPPLAAYGFVAWRAFHPAVFQWAPLEPSWSSVFAHLRGSEYGDLLGRFAPDDVQRQLLASHAYPILFPALALMAATPFLTRGPQRALLVTLLATALIQTFYAFHYGVRDPSCYFEPPMAIALLSLAVAGGGILGGVPARTRATAAAALGALALAGGVGLAWRGLPLGWAIRLGAEDTDRRMRATWEKIPPGPGFVLWEHDMANTFQVYQLLEHRRPELFAGNPTTLSWTGPRRAFRERYGFDPLAGLEPLTLERAREIPENVNRQTPLPVSIFDLYSQTVTVLPKPGAADSTRTP